MITSSSTFWIFLAVIIIITAYYMCNKDKSAVIVRALKERFGMRSVPVTARPLSVTARTAPVTARTAPVTARAAPVTARRKAMLQVDHNDPLLVTLFSRDAPLLPDGMKQEQFDRLVDEYYERNLKVQEIKIPRSLNFNYDQYSADQDRMAKETNAHYQQFVHREALGEVTDKITRGKVVGAPLQHRTFMKKVIKR